MRQRQGGFNHLMGIELRAREARALATGKNLDTQIILNLRRIFCRIIGNKEQEDNSCALDAGNPSCPVA
jgi:hypothetical protein